MTDRELMQQALEALENAKANFGDWWPEVIIALRERLAQPEQEPVVWMYQDKSTHEVRFQKHMRGFVDHGATYETPLYTTPPRREWRGCAECGKSGGWALYCVECMEKLVQPKRDGACRHCDGTGCVACDARHLPEQEPVAWNLRYNRYPREGDLLADIHLLRWQEALPQSRARGDKPCK